MSNDENFEPKKSPILPSVLTDILKQAVSHPRQPALDRSDRFNIENTSIHNSKKDGIRIRSGSGSIRNVKIYGSGRHGICIGGRDDD